MSYGIHPIAGIIAAFARSISGVQIHWAGCQPDATQRIYFANHTSHLDFVVLWSALPSEARALVRPVAAKDYWDKGIRAYLAQKVFHAVLVRRGGASQARDSEQALIEARALIDQLVDALGDSGSLILFPEGTRGTGETISPFRSGLYYLAKKRPDVELVPAYLENLSRILPKGEVIPMPRRSSLTFGKPLHIEESETKEAFLTRAHAALQALQPKGQS
jgi:1-acyl-sn-glycerol-3-phosphate acyltransferase